MMKKLFFAILPVVFLSCLSIDSKITLNSNGSGTLRMEYTVSSFARDWDASESGDTALPLPVNENDFRRSVAAVEGLTLVSYSRTESGDSTVIQASINFASLEALNRLVSEESPPFTLRQEGGRTVFEQVVTPGMKGAVPEQTQEFINAFFQPYSLKFSLTAPGAVVRSSPEGSRVSGNQASISFELPAVVQSPSPVVWRVEW